APRHLRAVAGCYFVASFAALGLPPYLTEILPALGDEDGRWAGLLYVVPTVFSALGGPLWGRLADRFGHKPLLLRAQLGLTAAFVLAGLADSLPLFAAALVLQGVLGGTYAASTGYLGAAVPDRAAMSRALTLMQVAARASLVAAPIAVGALSPWLPPQRQYLVLAVLPLAAALMLTALPSPPRNAGERQGRAPREQARVARVAARTGLRGRHPVGLYLLEFGFVFSTVVSFPYLVDLVQQAAPGAPAGLAGALFALPHLCFLLAAMPLHDRLTRRPHTSLVAGLALVSLGLLGHATAATVTDLVLVRTCFGAGLTLGLVGLSALAAEASRGRPPGSLFGWVELFSKAGAVASGVVATVTNAAWGPAGPVVAGAIAALALAVGSTLVRPSRPLPST
ncbi:MFS transporter, partial [Nocardioides sp.]|uniref:MFS transporter n=1 Tax=Nocardioides sp. TaxID=35761 RepID=UPI003561B32F